MLNTRSSKVLYYLTQQTEVTSIKELANKFGVSERSIRNDLQEIDELQSVFEKMDLQSITFEENSFHIEADLKS